VGEGIVAECLSNATAGQMEEEESLRIGDWQWPEEHLVEEAEDAALAPMPENIGDFKKPRRAHRIS